MNKPRHYRTLSQPQFGLLREFINGQVSTWKSLALFDQRTLWSLIYRGYLHEARKGLQVSKDGLHFFEYFNEAGYFRKNVNDSLSSTVEAIIQQRRKQRRQGK